MRISGPGNLSGVRARSGAKRDKTTGATFSPAETAHTSRSESSSAASATYGVDALLALQEVEDPLVGRRKRALKHGHEMLDSLEAVHAALLVGEVPVERLERIMGLIRNRLPSDEPSLEALIDDIELRARVELAKLGRYFD